MHAACLGKSRRHEQEEIKQFERTVSVGAWRDHAPKFEDRQSPETFLQGLKARLQAQVREFQIRRNPAGVSPAVRHCFPQAIQRNFLLVESRVCSTEAVIQLSKQTFPKPGLRTASNLFQELFGLFEQLACVRAFTLCRVDRTHSNQRAREDSLSA